MSAVVDVALVAHEYRRPFLGWTTTLTRSHVVAVFRAADDVENEVTLQPHAGGLSLLRGEVASHRMRKLIHRQVAKGESGTVVNRLSVRRPEPLDVRGLLQFVKRDEILFGMSLSVGEPTYKPSLHVTFEIEADGVVRLQGTVPDAVLRSYLETKVWVAPGVRSVINLTENILGDRNYVDIDRVVGMVIRQNQALPPAIRERIDHAAFDGSVYLNGSVDNGVHRQHIERDAWAIPEVMDVTNDILIAAG